MIALPKSDIEDPILIKPRVEIDEPIAPKFITDEQLPMRTNDRTLIELPKKIESKHEVVFPEVWFLWKRELLLIEIPDPIFTTRRIEIDDPMWKKSRMDASPWHLT
jgi:hypothetical protein